MGSIGWIILVGVLVALADSQAVANERRDCFEASSSTSEPPPCPVNPACIHSRTEARPGKGYDHLVHVSNAFTATISCALRG